MARNRLMILAALSILARLAEATDPDQLQDICVADLQSEARMNGYACKDEMNITAEDFLFTQLRQAGSTDNIYKAGIGIGLATQFPALNTQGLGVARVDLEVGGLIPPNVHPRASEVLFLLQGTMYAGFISSDHRLFDATLHPGDVMVFPRGLLHFQLNTGSMPIIAFAVLNSQNPGYQIIASALFGSTIPDDVIAKSLFLDHTTISRLSNIFAAP